jgi:hypothetical protein
MTLHTLLTTDENGLLRCKCGKRINHLTVHGFGNYSVCCPYCYQTTGQKRGQQAAINAHNENVYYAALKEALQTIDAMRKALEHALMEHNDGIMFSTVKHEITEALKLADKFLGEKK